MWETLQSAGSEVQRFSVPLSMAQSCTSAESTWKLRTATRTGALETLSLAFGKVNIFFKLSFILSSELDS